MIYCLVDYLAMFKKLQISEVILGIYRAALPGQRALLIP